MVDTLSQQYSMPVMNESGYVIILPNVANSEDLVQNPHPDPYAQSAKKLFPIGTKLINGERVWRYCYAGDTALTIAQPQQSGARCHEDHENDNTGGSITAIGSNIVYLTATSNITTSPADERDEYAEGYLLVNDGTGQGQSRKIKHNEGFHDTSEIKFELYEDLTIATAASSSTEYGVIRNPYWMTEDVTAVATGMCVGVPGIPVTENYYYWAQTGGPCAIIVGAALTLGTSVVVGTNAGACDPQAAADTEIIIGWPMSPCGTATEYACVYLTLD